MQETTDKLVNNSSNSSSTGCLVFSETSKQRLIPSRHCVLYILPRDSWNSQVNLSRYCRHATWRLCDSLRVGVRLPTSWNRHAGRIVLFTNVETACSRIGAILSIFIEPLHLFYSHTLQFNTWTHLSGINRKWTASCFLSVESVWPPLDDEGSTETVEKHWTKTLQRNLSP